MNFHEWGTGYCVHRTDKEVQMSKADKSLHDPVSRPSHYRRFEIEPVRFIMENNLPFWMGNVIKYVLRAEHKNGLEDLKKARRYLDMEIARQEGNKDFWT